MDPFEQINDYLDGLLDPEARRSFEAELARNPELAQNFQTLRDARESISARLQNADREAALRATLRQTEKDHFQSGQSAPKIPLMLWRAAAVLLLAIAAIFLFYPFKPKDFYAEYRRFPDAAFTTKSTDPSQINLSAAERAFNQKDYDAALAVFEKLGPEDSLSVEIRFFMALCRLELNRFGEAEATLAQIAGSSSAWGEEAQWYLALLYVKNKNYAAAKAAIAGMRPDNPHKTKAGELLEKIEN